MTQSADTDETLGLRELTDLVSRYVRGTWRFRWWALGLAWLGSVAAWAFVYLMPDEYGASSRVYVDTQNLLRPLLSGLSVETDVMNDVAVMTRAMVSRPSLERVARETDLDLRAETPVEYEAMLTSLERRVSINRDRENIYTIQFTDSDRNMALSVVKSMLDAFVEDTLGSKQEDSEDAERTLRAQIDEYEKRLNEADNRLKEFKQNNIGMMPGDRGDYYDQLQTSMAELASTQYRIRVTEQKRAALQRQLLGEEPVLGIMAAESGGSGRVTSVDGRIAEVESLLSNLQLQFTDKHPEVVRTKSLLADLQAVREEQLARMPASAPRFNSISNPLDMNPVYQNIKIQLSDAEVELATLQAESSQRESTVNRLRELVNVIPEVEAELNRLNRDYGVVRGRYEEMLKRWENLQTSQRVRSTSDSIRFRIIEPPFASSLPVGPDRTLFIVAGFVFAAGGAIGVAFLLNLLKPVFHTSRELGNQFGIPVLGSVHLEGRANRYTFAGLFGVGAFFLVTANVVAIVLAEPLSSLLRSIV